MVVEEALGFCLLLVCGSVDSWPVSRVGMVWKGWGACALGICWTVCGLRLVWLCGGLSQYADFLGCCSRFWPLFGG